MHLISCAESYLAHHALDGYDPREGAAELHELRGSFKTKGLPVSCALPCVPAYMMSCTEP